MSFRNREIYLIYKTHFIKPFLLSIELSFALSLHEEDRNELHAVLQKYRCYVSVQILQSWQCYTCMDVDRVLDTLLWQLPVLTSCCWEWVSLLYSDVQKATVSNSSFYEPLFSISGGKVFLFHYCVWLESKECTVETTRFKYWGGREWPVPLKCMQDVPWELDSEHITAEKRIPRAAGGHFRQREMKDILF